MLIFSRSLHQPSYKIKKKCFEAKIPKNFINNIFDNHKIVKQHNIDSVIEEILDDKDFETSCICCEFFDDKINVPEPNEIDSKRKDLIIFDDVL